LSTAKAIFQDFDAKSAGSEDTQKTTSAERVMSGEMMIEDSVTICSVSYNNIFDAFVM